MKMKTQNPGAPHFLLLFVRSSSQWLPLTCLSITLARSKCFPGPVQSPEAGRCTMINSVTSFVPLTSNRVHRTPWCRSRAAGSRRQRRAGGCWRCRQGFEQFQIAPADELPVCGVAVPQWSPC
ncbi:hypothetical protein B0J18DRAFT_75451 [Chaetomium sp. MPI-SDFR-AT-0129]|nr:hypothetical protein B0J18DRAFT_75451 [Chaetomium sp. MPI-SDFR-AT-0129]